MSEYTSTLEGFQRAMQWSLTGAPEDTKLYVEAISSPNIHYNMNGEGSDFSGYIKSLSEWRAKVSDYKPVVQDFLRDGDSLAARMTGIIKLEGGETAFESFMFAKVNKETGKLDTMKVRSIWGPVGGELEHGTK